MKDNKTNGVIVTFIDITQRKKALKEMERVIADHEILLDAIFHDIRTPLSTLLMAFKIIQEVPPDNIEQIQKLLQMQTNSVDKMKRLIYELTDTQEHENRYKTKAELLNFEHILKDVCFTLSSNIIQSGAVINSEWKVLQILFPRRILSSILYNLVSNAVEYKSPNLKPVIFVKQNRRTTLLFYR